MTPKPLDLIPTKALDHVLKDTLAEFIAVNGGHFGTLDEIRSSKEGKKSLEVLHLESDLENIALYDSRKVMAFVPGAVPVDATSPYKVIGLDLNRLFGPLLLKSQDEGEEVAPYLLGVVYYVPNEEGFFLYATSEGVFIIAPRVGGGGP